jgi:hypothetical protein
MLSHLSQRLPRVAQRSRRRSAAGRMGRRRQRQRSRRPLPAHIFERYVKGPSWGCIWLPPGCDHLTISAYGINRLDLILTRHRIGVPARNNPGWPMPPPTSASSGSSCTSDSVCDSFLAPSSTRTSTAHTCQIGRARHGVTVTNRHHCGTKFGRQQRRTTLGTGQSSCCARSLAPAFRSHQSAAKTVYTCRK